MIKQVIPHPPPSTILKILGLDDCWDNYIKRFMKLDIYYTREYTMLFSEIQGGSPQAAYFENKAGRVFYPFIKRKIHLRDGYFDIITPYGYGGPILEGEQVVLNDFYKLFKDYCIENNIISETVGLHPLLKNNEYLKEIMKTDYIRGTAAVDLTLPIEDIRKGYTSTNRRNIRKALKHGVYTSVSNEREDLESFIDLYYETMDRNHASNFYYFDRTYFYKQMQTTTLSKSVLIIAQYNKEIIGGVLLLIGTDFAHYHLGASKKDYLSLRPNNVLFDAMIEYAKSQGASILHLGGGYVDSDNLYKFKTSFSTNKSYEYFLGKHIINKEKYYEFANMVSINESEKNYFPIYRVPGKQK